jgi:Zn-dependent peptidase ImmA (M78 family)
MDESFKARISELRRLMGNQYAYIEYLDTADSDDMPVQVASLVEQPIRLDRKTLQNPYAYLDGEGGYTEVIAFDGEHLEPEKSEASSTTTNQARVRRRTDKQIEAEVQKLLTQLWNNRVTLWGGDVPEDPIDLLDANVALHHLGYKFRIEESLGQYRSASGPIEVAGLIDRTAKMVGVSRQFSPTVRAFTTAHELGHAVLHGAGGGVHRDRPIDGVKISREPTEYEADKFATYFLMPAKLVRARFAQVFGTDRFILNDDTAFALLRKTPEEVQSQCPTRRELARLLASTEQYNGRFLRSLVEQFNVSIEAMAIRLEELALIEP